MPCQPIRGRMPYQPAPGQSPGASVILAQRLGSARTNAKFQPPLETGATQEQTLYAVGCNSL
jgi:hypothetical protein